MLLICPQVLEDVTGEEFVLLMRVVSGLRVLQTVNGRQQLVELVVEQAFLEQALNPADPDTVDRLLQCTRQALPLFSVSDSSTLTASPGDHGEGGRGSRHHNNNVNTSLA